MRKVFIDCGFYCGKGVELFKKKTEYDESFEVFAFDANRSFESKIDDLKKLGINFTNKAVWTYDGEITFYASGRRHGQANGLFKNPSCPRRERRRQVECIDFSKWIKDNFSKDDFIVIKLDVEGAEYEILNKMLEDGTIHYANIMFIEYHYDRREGQVSQEDFIKLRKRLKEETRVDIRSAIEY